MYKHKQKYTFGTRSLFLYLMLETPKRERFKYKWMDGIWMDGNFVNCRITTTKRSIKSTQSKKITDFYFPLSFLWCLPFWTNITVVSVWCDAVFECTGGLFTHTLGEKEMIDTKKVGYWHSTTPSFPLLWFTMNSPMVDLNLTSTSDSKLSKNWPPDPIEVVLCLTLVQLWTLFG